MGIDGDTVKEDGRSSFVSDNDALGSKSRTKPLLPGQAQHRQELSQPRGTFNLFGFVGPQLFRTGFDSGCLASVRSEAS